MANGHGGYRRPEHPAAISGPGSLSQRTDGGPADRKQAVAQLPDAGYGEQTQFRGIQQAAPVQKVGPTGAAVTSAGAQGPRPLPLDAPSANPGEPVTAGANAGAGPGSDVLGLFNESDVQANDLRYLQRYLPALQTMADNTPHANTSFLALVRYLRSQI